MTALAIVALVVVLVLVTAGTVYMTYEAISGRCVFAWLWLVCGGLENAAKLIGAILVALVELVGSLSSND